MSEKEGERFVETDPDTFLVISREKEEVEKDEEE